MAARHSALLPLFDHQLPLDRFTRFDADGGSGTRVLEVTNDSQQTFPQGTLALFSRETFIGESILPRMDPGEMKRVVFGRDLQVELVVGQQETDRDTRRLEAESIEVGESKGVRLIRHDVVQAATQYRIINRSHEQRTIHIQFALPNNSRISGADRVNVRKEGGGADAVFDVEAGKEREARVVRHSAQSGRLTDPDLDDLRKLARSSGIASDQRKKLRKVVSYWKKAERQLARARQLAARVAALESRAQRLRLTLHSLAKARSKRTEDISRRLVTVEEQISKLEKRRAEISPERWRRLARSVLLTL